MPCTWPPCCPAPGHPAAGAVTVMSAAAARASWPPTSALRQPRIGTHPQVAERPPPCCAPCPCRMVSWSPSARWRAWRSSTATRASRSRTARWGKGQARGQRCSLQQAAGIVEHCCGAHCLARPGCCQSAPPGLLCQVATLQAVHKQKSPPKSLLGDQQQSPLCSTTGSHASCRDQLKRCQQVLMHHH